MPKFRDYFRKMMEEHSKDFEEFAAVHEKYAKDKQQWQGEFNRVGGPVVEIVREWEGRLCGHTEKGEYAKFSSNLAEKFWGEVKAFFPLIDFVGVEVTREPTFVIKGNYASEATVEEPVSQETDPDVIEIEKFEVLEDEDEFKITRF